MERRELLELARRVLSLPTAPYHEHEVRALVVEHCRKLGLRVEVDRVGNVIVKYQRSQAERLRHRASLAPLVFVAHMDHPGFEALGPHRAEFLGGVPMELFNGARVRFFVDGRVVRAKVKRVDAAAWPKQKIVELKADGRAQSAPRRGDIGMWDVQAFRVANRKLHATAIDDVLSVVVVLAALTEVARRRLKTHVWGVFTRAEEVGFQGAVELARSGKIPRAALVISMEMSRERPWARIGDGVVVRVGDRMTTFDAAATWFLHETARASGIEAQRCLMDGGTCEATAFAGFGYRVGGLCLPLGNYHNIGKAMKPQAEYVSIDDLVQLVRLSVAAASAWKRLPAIVARLSARVRQIHAGAPRELRR